MNNQEEENALTKEKDSLEKDEKEKEINEHDPLNTFEIIQFESNRPRTTSRNKYTTIIIFCIFIVLIALVTLYFLNKSDSIFNEDVKLFKLKIRKGKKGNDKSKGYQNNDDDEDDDEKKKRKKRRKKIKRKRRKKRRKKRRNKRRKRRRNKRRKKKKEKKEEKR